MVSTAAEASRGNRHRQRTEVPTELPQQAARPCLKLLEEFAPGCWENQDRSQSTSEISLLVSARDELGFQTTGLWVSNWKGHPSLAIVVGQRFSFKVEVGTGSQLTKMWAKNQITGKPGSCSDSDSHLEPLPTG